MLNVSRPFLTRLLILSGCISTACAQQAPIVEWQTNVPEAPWIVSSQFTGIRSAPNSEFQTIATPQSANTMTVRLLPDGKFKVARALPHLPGSYRGDLLLNAQDGGFIVSGTVRENNALERPFISKLDAGGVPVWNSTTGPISSGISTSQVVQKTFVLERPGYYLQFSNYNTTGTRTAVRRHYAKNGTIIPFRVTSLDRLLGFSEEVWVADICEAIDGGIIVAVDSYLSNSLYKITDSDSSYVLMNYAVPQRNGSIRKLIPTQARDGYYLLHKPSSGAERLLRLRPDGSIQWVVDPGLFAAGQTALLAEPNGVVIAGTTGGQVSVQKIGTTGDRLWQTDVATDTFTDITKTADGGYVVATNASQFIKLSAERYSTPPSSTFTVQKPTFDCLTGRLAIYTSGGNGSPVEYRILGVRDWSTDNVFTIPSWQRNMTGFNLEARQSGVIYSYPGFITDCGGSPPPASTALTFTNPGLDCPTGRLVLTTTGGDGSPVDYRVPGLRDWGSSPVFIVPDYQRTGTTFSLYARQNGNVINMTYTVTCGSGRLATPEKTGNWHIAVMGNPVVDETSVTISGLTGKQATIRLTDVSGNRQQERSVLIRQDSQQETVRVTGPAGLYLLQVISGGRQQTLKVLKQ